MRDFRQFLVWQRAHALALGTHAVANRIPARGFTGLASQLRRASAAVPANIAEGCGHTSRREFARFLQVALASLVETDNHLQFALDLRAVDEPTARKLLQELTTLRRMLATLLGRVREELRTSDQAPSDSSIRP